MHDRLSYLILLLRSRLRVIKKNVMQLMLYLRGKRLKIVDNVSKISYSQEGEDLLLKRLFEDKINGFYVDVGAHHPYRFSNTCIFYANGWRGINIDPNPEAMTAFRLLRSSDINVETGVAERAGTLQYHYFDDAALNSFDTKLVRWRLENTPYKVIDACVVPVRRLDEILEQHLSVGQHIDFLSVDAEGLDLSVLNSNDWSKYRPTCVLAESLATVLEDVIATDLYKLMASNGYQLFAKTMNTLVFVDASTKSNLKVKLDAS